MTTLRARATRYARATWLSWCALLVALLVAGGGVASYARVEHNRRVDAAETDHNRRVDQARSTLSVCLEVEKVKAGDRRTIQRSLDRLPSIAYYRTHPAELQRAIKDTVAEITARAPRDCYALPAVRNVGLRPPKA